MGCLSACSPCFSEIGFEIPTTHQDPRLTPLAGECLTVFLCRYVRVVPVEGRNRTWFTLTGVGISGCEPLGGEAGRRDYVSPSGGHPLVMARASQGASDAANVQKRLIFETDWPALVRQRCTFRRAEIASSKASRTTYCLAWRR